LQLSGAGTKLNTYYTFKTFSAQCCFICGSQPLQQSMATEIPRVCHQVCYFPEFLDPYSSVGILLTSALLNKDFFFV